MGGDLSEQKIKDVLHLLIENPPLDEVVNTREHFDALCGIAEDFGWVKEEKDDGVLLTHPDNPDEYRKFLPYSLIKNKT